jgi:hypothetical protein
MIALSARHSGRVFAYIIGTEGWRGFPSVLRCSQLGCLSHGGPTVFAHACKMGLEGIVSKRKTSAYCPCAIYRSRQCLARSSHVAQLIIRNL